MIARHKSESMIPHYNKVSGEEGDIMGGDSRRIWARLRAQEGSWDGEHSTPCLKDKPENQGESWMKRVMDRASSVCEGTPLVRSGSWAEAAVTTEWPWL